MRRRSFFRLLTGFSKRIVAVFALGLFSQLALSQGLPNSSLTGKVTGEGRTPLPGVTVTVESPALQGTRTAVTSQSGDYIFNLLPPGGYTVTFVMDGMQTVKRSMTLVAARPDRLDIEMQPARVAEAVTVSGETAQTAVLETTQVTTNYNQKFIEKLPIARNLNSVTTLSGGVTNNGPNGNIMISGAQSFENLFLINGVVANENIRGQAHDLFIEDAIQETTVLTGNISAEYGRFTGGVVSMITKSGGNRFSGSFRTNFTNDDWTEVSPFGEERIDDINQLYEATLGGPIWPDRIWFFTAGRFSELRDGRETRPTARPGDINPTPIAYTHGTDELRLEGKLTASITPRHNLVASYIDIDEEELNNSFTRNILDTKSLVTRQLPNTLLAVNYNGVLSDKLFIEAQYSQKEFTFENSGANCFDLICGTLLLDRSRASARFHSPTFSNLTPEGRDNESWLLKSSYFLSTPGFGTHDIRMGYENFSETRFANNHQSGSDYRIFATSAIIRGTDVFPVFQSPGDTTFLRWTPIFEGTTGSDFTTHSVFVNDRLNLNEHWSFNLGVRYDKNDGADSSGNTVANDDAISPRLAVHYDIGGNGKFVLNAGYGQYVSKIAEGVGSDTAVGGVPATLDWFYRGPCINCDANAPTSSLQTTEQALQALFDWFFNVQGGTSTTPTRLASIPGLSTQIRGSLESPKVKEYTAGFGAALGSNGFARVDAIYRDWDDFYSSRTNLSTGKTEPNQFGQVFDISLIENSNRLDRRYLAAQAQLGYRIGRLFAGGNYTWSRLYGNFIGETGPSGPVTGGIDDYPEYSDESFSFKSGYLDGDQRHKVRAWVGYDLPTRFGDFNVSVLQSYDSGRPYAAVGGVDSRPYVTNPGYESPPSDVDYFFTSRQAFRTDDISRTDVALNYSIRLFKSLEIFLQPEVLNVFNEDGLDTVNTTVNTRVTQTGFARFNPFTDTPVQGPRNTSVSNPTTGPNYDLGPNFGKATSELNYQLPRTFRFSVGLRF